MESVREEVDMSMLSQWCKKIESMLDMCRIYENTYKKKVGEYEAGYLCQMLWQWNKDINDFQSELRRSEEDSSI